MRTGLLLLSLLLASCSNQPPPSGDKIPAEAEAALRLAPTWELYSLDPDVEQNADDPANFRGWKVLGSVEIKDDATRQPLLESLKASVAANPGVVAACFWPRHGIRVIYNNQQYDFAICFQCYHANWYLDDRQQTGFNPTDSPADAFNSVLRKADVPLPRSP